MSMNAQLAKRIRKIMEGGTEPLTIEQITELVIDCDDVTTEAIAHGVQATNALAVALATGLVKPQGR